MRTLSLLLLNPRIIERSESSDEQYEGCLSFFDERGIVPRSLSVTVVHTTLDSAERTTVYERALARHVQHEVDHLEGLLYTSRMPVGAETVDVDEYRRA